MKPPAARPFGLKDQLAVAGAWFGYNLQWGALLAIVLPRQIEAIVGAANKEWYNGLVQAIGAAAALVITPIAGALSDRSRSRFGRRRPFMVVGALVDILFLALLACFGPRSLIGLFVLCYVGIQAGCNWLGGPYAGLIPDVVPKEQIGAASGWQGLMNALGFLIGALAASLLIHGDRFWPAYAFIALAMVFSVAFTVSGVREQPVTEKPPPFRLDAFLRSFWLDPREHRDFYWVLGTRALVTMGVYSIFTFFLYFLQDVVLPHAQPGLSGATLRDAAVTQSGYLIAIILAAGIPTSIVGGWLSDRCGRKLLVYLSGGIMAAASLVYIGVTFSPSLGATFLVAALFGVGNGAYTAVDWALAVDVLPAGEDAAKDMGIWHVAFVLPQVIAPALTGAVLTLLKGYSLSLGYTVVFCLTAFWFVIGTVLVRQIRGVR